MEKINAVKAVEKTAHLSVDEIQDKLESLSRADLVRLRKQAYQLAGNSGLTPDDLIQEAALRALRGSRKCPRDVLFEAFFYGVIKSIVHEERKQWKRDQPVDREHDETIRDMGQTANPEKLIADRQSFEQLVACVEDIFADDDQGLTIVMGDMDGCSPVEICAIEPMTEKEYATARRRVRRKLDKEFPKGYEND